MKKLNSDLALVAVSPEAEKLLPLPPDRIAHYRDRLIGLRVEATRTQAEMADEMVTVLAQQKQDNAAKRRELERALKDLDHQNQEIGQQAERITEVADELKQQLKQLGGSHRTINVKGQTVKARAGKARDIPTEAPTDDGNEGTTKKGALLRIIRQEGQVSAPRARELAVGDGIINPEGLSADDLKSPINSLLQSLKKKGLIEDVGEGRYAVWQAKTGRRQAALRVKREDTPRTERKQRTAKKQSKPAKASKGTPTPKEGSKSQTLYLEIVRLEQVPSSDLKAFAHGNATINPGHDDYATIAQRISVMLADLAKKGFVKNIGEAKQGIWVPTNGRSAAPRPQKVPAPAHRAADATKPRASRSTDPPATVPSRSLGPAPAPAGKSSRQDLQQSFLNEVLQGKKKGTTLDQIVAAARESDHSGFGKDGDDADDIRFEIAQFLQMSRRNYAGDNEQPQHWWIREEAPRPFASERK